MPNEDIQSADDFAKQFPADPAQDKRRFHLMCVPFDADPETTARHVAIRLRNDRRSLANARQGTAASPDFAFNREIVLRLPWEAVAGNDARRFWSRLAWRIANELQKQLPEAAPNENVIGMALRKENKLLLVVHAPKSTDGWAKIVLKEDEFKALFRQLVNLTRKAPSSDGDVEPTVFAQQRIAFICSDLHQEMWLRQLHGI